MATRQAAKTVNGYRGTVLDRCLATAFADYRQRREGPRLAAGDAWPDLVAVTANCPDTARASNPWTLSFRQSG